MRRLLEIDSNAKGIAITGYSSDPVVSNYRAYGFSGFLTKPASKDELSKVINEVFSKDQ
jgi:two-component system cell cycle sensor histidine kinase/response regulator CckA